MSGWPLAILLAAATLAAIVAAARAPRGAGLIGAAMLAALAGYAWQGRPGLNGRPTPPRANHPADDALFARERKVWLDQVGPDAQALDAADGLIAGGDPAYAVGILRAGVARAPRDMALWIGLGNALVTYADGSVTPPARYAFERAAAIAPLHPAPPYLLALAYAQAGDLDAAEALWRGLLARPPADAPWKALVREKLAVLERIRVQFDRSS